MISHALVSLPQPNSLLYLPVYVFTVSVCNLSLVGRFRKLGVYPLRGALSVSNQPPLRKASRVFCFVAITKPNNTSECLPVKHLSFRSNPYTYPDPRWTRTSLLSGRSAPVANHSIPLLRGQRPNYLSLQIGESSLLLRSVSPTPAVTPCHPDCYQYSLVLGEIPPLGSSSSRYSNPIPVSLRRWW